LSFLSCPQIWWGPQESSCGVCAIIPLARLFTAEYAGLFDVLLPGLAARELPIPLGGSSNHFRTDILRRAGGWDPFNVTEDADLGTRLARFGYRTAVINSTTYEEAPATLKPWLKQRTRWFKGWLQTWFVHMRRPLRLVRELGLLGFVTFQLMLVGTVFAALVQPYALLMALDALLLGALNFEPAFDLPGLTWVHGAAMGSGYLFSIVLAIAGLKRRRLLTARWLLVLPPLMIAYWALLSIAAWRALYQFIFDRYRWEKTEHGLARVPRRSAASVGNRYR
jgi:cellulose synthase/poly-beta-1,6-N-acetylglucosamine synthase-like glycosyltransferase